MAFKGTISLVLAVLKKRGGISCLVSSVRMQGQKLPLFDEKMMFVSLLDKETITDKEFLE